MIKNQDSTHPITSETQNSMDKIQSLGSPSNQSADVYHVVVGTRAIQEGISMNWASSVIHWDLPPNPQSLEQSTWRLTAIEQTKILTYSIQYTLLQIRIAPKFSSEQYLTEPKTTDIILGHEHKPEYWPTDYSQNPKE